MNEINTQREQSQKLWAYVDSAEPLLERIRRAEALSADAKRDSLGMAIEDFGLPLNLMLALTAQLVEGDLAACITAIRPRTTTPSPNSQKAECL